jgi:hypothetical protein
VQDHLQNPFKYIYQLLRQLPAERLPYPIFVMPDTYVEVVVAQIVPYLQCRSAAHFHLLAA